MSEDTQDELKASHTAVTKFEMKRVLNLHPSSQGQSQLTRWRCTKPHSSSTRLCIPNARARRDEGMQGREFRISQLKYQATAVHLCCLPGRAREQSLRRLLLLQRRLRCSGASWRLNTDSPMPAGTYQASQDVCAHCECTVLKGTLEFSIQYSPCWREITSVRGALLADPRLRRPVGLAKRCLSDLALVSNEIMIEQTGAGTAPPTKRMPSLQVVEEDTSGKVLLYVGWSSLAADYSGAAERAWRPKL
jgi:hypothetical protein